MALANYVDLDLSQQSSIAQDLFARAEREARRASLNLTGDGDAGAVSANLTQEMSAWLGTHIGHKRQGALNAIAAAARNIRGKGNTEGICAEIEEDRLKRERNTHRTDETLAFYGRHQSRIDDLNALQERHDAMQVAEGGRDAKTPSTWAAIGLPALVAIPEGFMNYASFVALTGLGVAGFGLTCVVGAAIGVAAYLAGQLWKAWHFYMRAYDEGQQQTGMRMIWLASALLTVSLGVVGYARYKMVAEKALRELVLGLVPTNPILSTVLLLTGNLLVFFLGAAFTYMIHDENPLFADKAAKLKRDRAQFDGVKRRELEGKLAEIQRRYLQDRERMLRVAALTKNQSEYAAVADDMGRLVAKDEEVIGLLQSYRSDLIDRIEMRDADTRINPAAAERQSGITSGTISLSEFAVQQLHLYRGAR